MKIEADSIDRLYVDACQHLYYNNMEAQPRGFQCFETSPAHLILQNPRANILGNPTRKISRHFMMAEFLWMLRGSNDLDEIAFYNKYLRAYSDDGKTLSGAYGPKIEDQFSLIIEKLKEDPETRQAVMTIWERNPEPSKDIPCTVALQFIRRPSHRLNLIVYMRSNDIWLGFPYDVFNFTSWQIMLAGFLGLEVGTYHHIAGSFHVYKEHKERLLEVCETVPSKPQLSSSLEGCREKAEINQAVINTILIEELIRKNKLEKAERLMSDVPVFFREKLYVLFNYVRRLHETTN